MPRHFLQAARAAGCGVTSAEEVLAGIVPQLEPALEQTMASLPAGLPQQLAAALAIGLRRRAGTLQALCSGHFACAAGNSPGSRPRQLQAVVPPSMASARLPGLTNAIRPGGEAGPRAPTANNPGYAKYGGGARAQVCPMALDREMPGCEGPGGSAPLIADPRNSSGLAIAGRCGALLDFATAPKC